MRVHAFIRKPQLPRSGAPAAPQVAPGSKTHGQTAGIRQILGRRAVQPKLRIGAPNDAYEREADHVADQVMAMSASAIRLHASPRVAQRMCDDCAEEVRTKQELAAPPRALAAVDTAASRGTESGHPLPTELRSFFEPRFGRDFSQVRVHTGPRAAESAQAIQARAYTRGRDVVFGSGEYAPDSHRGRWLMAHELAHIVQQARPDRSGVLQRQPAPAVVPAYRDCTAAITGEADANEQLEAARLRAREFVGAAIRTLGAAPAAGTTYATALNRHFINPTAAQRAAILANFEQIRGTLRVGNYICNSNNICGAEQAFWIQADDLVHVCPPFWDLDRTCGAIVLIHEGGHDVGVDAALAGHPPNRGDAAYPVGNTAPPVGQTTAQRMQNPDAYAFFAAHIWRSTDTSRTCF